MAFNGETIAFIGAGVMGEAIIAGLLHQRLVDARSIIASDPRREHVQGLADKYGIRATTDNLQAASEADVLVLAVKPQGMEKVLPELGGKVDGARLVLSIVAGVSMSTIADGLCNGNIVRSMPNTPGQIGQGITVWTAASQVGAEQRAQAESLLGALGEQIYAADELFLDMATALSGSGPAYVFMFMEALVDAGVHMGFARRGRGSAGYANAAGVGCCMRGSRVCIRRSCATRSRARAGPQPRRCTKWRRAACGLSCRKAYGLPIVGRRRWVDNKEIPDDESVFDLIRAFWRAVDDTCNMAKLVCENIDKRQSLR